MRNKYDWACYLREVSHGSDKQPRPEKNTNSSTKSKGILPGWHNATNKWQRNISKGISAHDKKPMNYLFFYPIFTWRTRRGWRREFNDHAPCVPTKHRKRTRIRKGRGPSRVKTTSEQQNILQSEQDAAVNGLFPNPWTRDSFGRLGTPWFFLGWRIAIGPNPHHHWLRARTILYHIDAFWGIRIGIMLVMDAS